MKFEDFKKDVELKDDDNNYVRFIIIDCTTEVEKLTEKQRNYLAIIKGDVYEACQGAKDVNKFIVVEDWTDNTYSQSIKLVFDYVNNNEEYHDIPIFVIVGDDYELVDLTIKSSFDLGFYPADFLCYFDNNRVLLKTRNLKIFESIAKNHYKQVIEFESKK